MKILNTGFEVRVEILAINVLHRSRSHLGCVFNLVTVFEMGNFVAES